jgi:O-antigen/teichoic acid export membrane protein
MPTQLGTLAAQATLRIDQLLMSLFIGREQLGYYVIAVAFGAVVQPIFSALATVALPRVLQAASLEAGGLQSARFIKIGFALAVPVIAVGVPTMPWVLPLIFGTRYVPSVLPAQVLLAAGVFQGQNALCANCLRGLGAPGRPTVAETVGLLVTAGLLAVLLPTMGILGAALASLLAYATVTVVELRFVSVHSGLSLTALARAPCLPAAPVAAAAIPEERS